MKKGVFNEIVKEFIAEKMAGGCVMRFGGAYGCVRI